MHYKCVTEQLKIERTRETKEHWKTEPENHQQVWIWIPKIKKLEYFNCQLLFNLKIITGMQKKKIYKAPPTEHLVPQYTPSRANLNTSLISEIKGRCSVTF